MNEKNNPHIFNNPIIGYAHHKIILNADNQPVDYVLLEVNETFEKLTGLQKKLIIDKKITEVMPDIVKSSFNWISFYGKVALTGEKQSFDQYSEMLGKWYRVHAFSEEKMFFTTIFVDITEQKQNQEKTEKLKEQFELAVAGTNDGIWDWNIRTNELFLSKRWKAMLGYKDDELENNFDTFMNLLYHEDIPEVNTFVQSYLEGKIAVYNIEFRMKHKDGSLVWILAKGEALRDENGIPYRMAGSHSDVTARKEMEEKIKEGQIRLELAMDAGEHGFWDWNLISNETYFSLNYYKMLGYEDKELPMNLNTFMDLIHPEDAERIMPVVQKSIDTGSPYAVEFRLRCKDGFYKWILGKGKTYLDCNLGKPCRAVGVHIDINDRKIAEEALFISDERFNRAISGTGAGLWDWDMVKNIVFFSVQWKKMLGYEDHEIPNDFTGWRKLWHPDEVAYIEKTINDYLEGKTKTYEVEHRLQHKNGSWRWILTRGETEKDSQGKAIRWTGTNIDITERKKAEEELQKAKELAEAASKAKSEFLANMSHEIRTPLNGVIGFTDLLRKTPLTPLQQQYVDNANVSGHTLLGIINDILDFSKIEAGMMELELIKTDILSLLEDSIDIVKYAASEKKLEVLLQIDSKMPRFAKVDPVRLKQILANLLGNAVKFTHHGEVELRVDFNQLDEYTGSFKFFVRDTGIGISDEQQQKLFQAFTQADNSTTREFGGTGLGLIISDMIAHKMGDKIRIKSEQGKGSVFYFEIETEFENGEKKEDALANIKRCLLIDDNKTNLFILQNMLANWDIISDMCEDGLSALKKLKTSEPYDLIICDYHMPYIDGLDTIKMIREKCDKAIQKIPIILLHSSSGTQELHSKCKELEVKFLLSKPVKSNILYSYLSNLYQATPSELPEPVKDSETQISDSYYKILIAEDNPLNMFLIESMIKEMLPDALILKAVNGSEAVSLFQNEKPDIMLMDVQMPVMDGIQATLKIKELDKDKKAIIVALTAGALKEEKEKCLNAGMNDFLTKPIEPEKIKEVFLKYLKPLEKKNQSEQLNCLSLMKKLGNNKELFNEVCEIALNTFPEYLERLKKAINSSNYTEIKSIAHLIKGSALNIDFMSFASISGNIEKLAKTENLTEIEIEFSKLTEEWACVEVNIKKKCKDYTL